MIPKRTLQTIVSVCGACVVGYFLYHTIQGEHGWLAQLRLQSQVTEAQERLDTLQQERKDLDHRVQMMRSEHMDPDLLDEQSRKMLNYSKPNEVIILTPEGKLPPPMVDRK